MKTRLLGGIVAIVLAIAGTLLLVTYVQGSEARAQKDLQPVDVLVVESKIPAGSNLQTVKAAVKLASLPAGSVPNGALKSLDGLDGKVSGVDLLPGETLLGARLVDPTSLAAPGSVPVPAGLQEISLHLDAQRVVGGRLAAGDTVGVVVLLDDSGAQGAAGGSAQMVFHKVLVTSVQRAVSQAKTTSQAQSGQEQANTQLPDGAFIVTLARNDVDSTKIAFGAKYGDIWLTKEPSTASESPNVTIKRAEVLR
ncbi:Flp pilus assembly protein CpaB [Arthrobacter sp. MMS18-M83]|uniref:Flp pilus assembly protein CpaB n=1 Tax=Arthrobacter sp. MMS18-M83 TaxID=2996261 RepID=UPI00227D6723|nr:RcpC/CpaB family pilus assembly protein [Arthrobacter sp. MMS18-M83]WAH96115.1 RcpC/CpaB family pilus assembly protein [Arthrobacter sp. MMS18-M83]